MELAKAVTVTFGGFPDSSQKGLLSKATVVVPADNPNSLSSSSDSNDMSDHGGDAGGPAPIPAPVSDLLPRVSIKVPLPKKFTDKGEDLKPEAIYR